MSVALAQAPSDWSRTLDAARFACGVAEGAADEADASTIALVADIRDGGATAPLVALLEDEADALRRLADWLQATQTRLLNMAARQAGRPT